MHLDGYRILSVKQYFSFRKLLLQGYAQGFKLLVSHILFISQGLPLDSDGDQ